MVSKRKYKLTDEDIHEQLDNEVRQLGNRTHAIARRIFTRHSIVLLRTDSFRMEALRSRASTSTRNWKKGERRGPRRAPLSWQYKGEGTKPALAASPR
jgi:hypothetical protein